MSINRQFVEEKKDSIDAVVTASRELTPEKIVKTVLIVATKTPALLHCSKSSVMQAIMTSVKRARL